LLDWEKAMNEPGSGAAGGIGFALSKALPDAKLVHGFPLVSALLQWQQRATEADIIVTGEGRIDASSLAGKGPISLLEFTSKQQKILFLAGSVEEKAKAILQESYPNIEFLVISKPDEELSIALKNTLKNATLAYGNWLTANI
jgi:glycerate kinase